MVLCHCRGEHPVARLKGFHGVLQVDGYARFGQVKAATNQPPQLAFCWAHARRKFYDVHVATKSPIAHEARAGTSGGVTG